MSEETMYVEASLTRRVHGLTYNRASVKMLIRNGPTSTSSSMM